MRAQQRKAGTNHEDPGPVAGAYDRIIWAPECLSNLLLQVCLLESTHSPSGPAPLQRRLHLHVMSSWGCFAGTLILLHIAWCQQFCPCVSSSVHGTSAQDSLIIQCTTIFHACETCTRTRWLMLIRSGASLGSSLSPWTTVVSFIHCVLLTLGKCFPDDYFQTGNSMCLLGF